MIVWLHENCGADGSAMTGKRGALYDAVSICFLNPVLAGSFVALVHRLQGRDR